MVADRIQVIASSESWTLHDNLKGRFVAVQLCIASDELHAFPQGFRFWVVSVYAPTNCNRETIRSFYHALNNEVTNKLTNQHVYYLGDWNGCLQLHRDQIEIPDRSIRITNGDSAL
jgi:hypothetical protein